MADRDSKMEKGEEDDFSWMLEDEKALVRKFDYRVMPLVAVMYFLAYLDRVNIGNAIVANNEKLADTMAASLMLNGFQFNWSVAIFFVPYVLFELPSNVMMKVAGPRVWLARIMISWGIIATCQAFTSDFTGLMICRSLLGAAEAGLFPGVLYYFTFWYRKHEISSRVAILFSFNSIASNFSGLLATAIAFMNGVGGLKGWQWIFVLEGVPSVVIGILAWRMLPNFPQNSQPFLTPFEQEIAIRRLPTTAANVNEKSFDWKEFWHTVKDPMLLLFCLASFFMILPSYGVIYFRPSVIAGLGFSGNMANLMSAWPGVATAVFDQYWGWRSDVQKERPLHILFALSIGVAGTAFLLAGQLYMWSAGVRYFLMFIQNLAGPAIPILFVYRANTIKGATAIATASALTIAVGNIGGFLAPFIFPDSWAPLYINAIWISLGALMAAMVCVCIIWWMEVRRTHSDAEWAAELSSGVEVARAYAKPRIRAEGEGTSLSTRETSISTVSSRPGWPRFPPGMRPGVREAAVDN